MNFIIQYKNFLEVFFLFLFLTGCVHSKIKGMEGHTIFLISDFEVFFSDLFLILKVFPIWKVVKSQIVILPAFLISYDEIHLLTRTAPAITPCAPYKVLAVQSHGDLNPSPYTVQISHILPYAVQITFCMKLRSCTRVGSFTLAYLLSIYSSNLCRYCTTVLSVQYRYVDKSWLSVYYCRYTVDIRYSDYPEYLWAGAVCWCVIQYDASIVKMHCYGSRCAVTMCNY